MHLDGRKGHYLISIPSTVPPMAGFTPADTLKRQPVRPRKEHTLHTYCTKSEKLQHVYVINQTYTSHAVHLQCTSMVDPTCIAETVLFHRPTCACVYMNTCTCMCPYRYIYLWGNVHHYLLKATLPPDAT